MAQEKLQKDPQKKKIVREQFEMRIHPSTLLGAGKRMIDILNPEAKVIEALTNIDLPSGVNIDVKMM